MSEKSTAITDSSNYYSAVVNRPTIKDDSNVVYKVSKSPFHLVMYILLCFIKQNIVSEYEAPSDYEDDTGSNGVSSYSASTTKNHSRFAGNDYEAVLHHSEYASAINVYSNTMREPTAYDDSVLSEYSEVGNPDDATVNDEEEIYADPGHSKEDIYACFEKKRFRMIKRNDVR